MTQERRFDDHHMATYSNLLEWLNQLPMRAAPAQQWISTIRTAKGIREEEIQRSELISTLLNFDGDEKLEKSDLLMFAENNLSACRPVLLTERMTFYRPDLHINAFDPEDIPQRVMDSFAGNKVIRTCELSSFGYKIIGATFEDMFGSGTGWFVFDNRWRPIPPGRGYMNSWEAIDAAYTAAQGVFAKYVSPAQSNQYERYSLLGKKHNYREWLVCLPHWPHRFHHDHFELGTTVLHLRGAVWKHADGSPVYLIDEIQSDWHAWGRRSGYLSDEEPDGADSVPDAPFIKEWHEMGVKIAIWIAMRSGCSRVAFTTGQQQCERWGELEGLRLLYDKQIPKSLSKLASSFGCHYGLTEISVKKPREKLAYRRGLGWELKTSDSKARPKIVKNEAVAMRYLQAAVNERIEQVRILEISPALAEVVRAKGVPLFGWW